MALTKAVNIEYKSYTIKRSWQKMSCLVLTDIKQNTPNTWVCRSVEIAAKYGIVSTYNKTLRPEEYITEAEAIAMILAAVKLTPVIDKDKPWQDSIMQTAFDLGVITTKSPGTAIMKR